MVLLSGNLLGQSLRIPPLLVKLRNCALLCPARNNPGCSTGLLTDILLSTVIQCTTAYNWQLLTSTHILCLLFYLYPFRYLEYTLDPNKIRKQDATSTIVYIANNVVGQSLAWDFVRARWSYIFNQWVQHKFFIIFQYCISMKGPNLKKESWKRKFLRQSLSKEGWGC